MFSGRRKKGPSRSGCGYVLVQGLILTALLFLNGLLVRAFILANPAIDDARISQTVQFTIPILMIFAELWIYDFLTAKTSDELE